MHDRRTVTRIDVTDTDRVAAFLVSSDACGPPGSEAAERYWATVRFVAPDWMVARANQLDPFSQEYFELQDQLYVFLRGRPYTDGPCEFTGLDKEAAFASILAYPDRTPRELNRYMRAHAKFVDHIDSDQPCDILEVGSGWGFSAEYLARLGHRVTAVATNPDLVEVASRRSERQGLGIDYRLGTFESLPLAEDERFDVVYCFEAFHHARDFRGTLSRFAGRLRPGGRLMLFGEPIIDPAMWPCWGLRLDPLSVYSIAKFGSWESGWTRAFMGSLFRSAGLSWTFIDENSDLERYMIGRPGLRYEIDQLSHRPAADGWLRDRDHLVSVGDSRIEFFRALHSVTLEVESFAPFALQARLESEALGAPLAVEIAPGASRIDVPLATPRRPDHWRLRIVSQTWNPLRVTGAGADTALSFHLRGLQEFPAGGSDRFASPAPGAPPGEAPTPAAQLLPIASPAPRGSVAQPQEPSLSGR